MSPWTYRRATLGDLDFLVTALIDAERSGTERTLYERVFELDTKEQQGVIERMFGEDMKGCEVHAASFWLAEEAGRPVACTASWVEEEEGVPSNVVRAHLLSSALDARTWARGEPRLRALQAIAIAREPGALQLEAIHASPLHRGRGLVASLLSHILSHARSERPNVQRAQILSVAGNENAARAFTKAGFVVTARTQSADPTIARLFPGAGRVLWGRKFP